MNNLLEEVKDKIPEPVKKATAETTGIVGVTTLVGAGIGSVVPVIGTAIGAAAGATLGGVTLLVKKIKEKIDE